MSFVLLKSGMDKVLAFLNDQSVTGSSIEQLLRLNGFLIRTGFPVSSAHFLSVTTSALSQAITGASRVQCQ